MEPLLRKHAAGARGGSSSALNEFRAELWGLVAKGPEAEAVRRLLGADACFEIRRVARLQSAQLPTLPQRHMHVRA